MAVDLQAIKQIAITDFLRGMGFLPVKQRGTVFWYLAPYRSERTPSLKVDTQKNRWFDFGIGRGGNILDLAGEFIGSGDFIQQAEYISRRGHASLAVPEKQEVDTRKESEPLYTDVWVRELCNKHLIAYLEERGIDYAVAAPNCMEVRYRVYGKRYYAIGFQNRSGGLELRNRYFKGCIAPKDVSLIDNQPDCCVLFEGFMDYLSAMMLGIVCGSDYLILNSVCNIERVRKELQRYRVVECYLDNDDAGKRALESLRHTLGERLIDRSSLYADCKDLNEYLVRQNELLNT